jgi:hypothetical protein
VSNVKNGIEEEKRRGGEGVRRRGGDRPNVERQYFAPDPGRFLNQVRNGAQQPKA